MTWAMGGSWRPDVSEQRTVPAGDPAACGHPNPIWWAPNDLWNRVVGTPDNPRGEGLVLCPNCFLDRVHAADEARTP